MATETINGLNDMWKFLTKRWRRPPIRKKQACWLLPEALAEALFCPGSVQRFFCWRKWCCFSFKWRWKLRGFMSKLEMFRQIQQVLDSLNFYHDSFGWVFLSIRTPSPYLARWAPQWCERWLIDRMIEDASSTNHSSPSCNPNLANYLNCCFH